MPVPARFAPVAGLLLAAAAVAPAGPLPLSPPPPSVRYSVWVTPTHSARPLLDARGLTDPEFRADTLFPLPSAPPFAEPSAYWLENWGRSPYSPTGYNPYTEDVTQEAKVRLTHEATGDEHWLYFSSTFTFEFLFDPRTNRWENSRALWRGWPAADNPAEWYTVSERTDGLGVPDRFTRYALTAEQGGFSLSVTPDVVPPVPEPATLVLAGLGLGAVGVRRLRR